MRTTFGWWVGCDSFFCCWSSPNELYSLSRTRALSLYYSSRAVVVALTRCCIAPTCHSDLYHTATWTSILRCMSNRLVVWFFFTCFCAFCTHTCVWIAVTHSIVTCIWERDRREKKWESSGLRKNRKFVWQPNCSQPCDFFGFPGWIRSRSITNSTPRHFVESKFWMCVRKSHQ